MGLGFEHTSIYRPGVLIVPEGRDEIRIVEWMLQRLLSLFDWGPYFSIPTKQLAKAMVNLALRDNVQRNPENSKKSKTTVRILENKEIFDSIE